ncbi:glycosyltransferase family 2 protein [Patulibacter defluvii]|uniref:glycosyltransferase family 2 protein n=1 Tax=Patulibacter defluvii TaxID=3095358 RepID=UPI002A748FE5|nr:glycosyltransferase family 2 protein [Patulibacter sp. DM4]
MPVDTERISVVIPTRDRATLLERTLRSLARVEGAAGLEIVVIDDGSETPLADQLPLAELDLDLRVLRQEPGGLNVGRNSGVAATSREIVAFLDDDVLVEPDWGIGVAAAFDGRRALIGGRILADAPIPVPDWVHPQKRTYISVLDLGDRPGPFPSWAGPVGANFAVLRDVLHRVGTFRPGLDRTGKSLLSGGDTELVGRVLAAGLVVEYWPAATVHHHIPVERLTKAWFRERARAQGRTNVLMDGADDLGPRALAGEALRALRAGGIAAKRVRQRQSLIDAELWLWSSRGRLEARRDLRRARREREDG